MSTYICVFMIRFDQIPTYLEIGINRRKTIKKKCYIEFKCLHLIVMLSVNTCFTLKKKQQPDYFD